MNGKEYVDKYFTKEQLINELYHMYCPRDFGFETEYSIDNKEKWCTDNYTGDCEKCWNSRAIDFAAVRGIENIKRDENSLCR